MPLITCARGCRHFGALGAAGLLLTSEDRVLLQLRANSHHSGTWSTPGGSLDAGESPIQAALREVAEELVGVPGDLQPTLRHVADHGGWAYRTFVCRIARPVSVWPRNEESADVAWVQLAEVETLVLHPGFAAAWPALRASVGSAPVAA